jgi:hypothetical protein
VEATRGVIFGKSSSLGEESVNVSEIMGLMLRDIEAAFEELRPIFWERLVHTQDSVVRDLEE